MCGGGVGGASIVPNQVGGTYISKLLAFGLMLRTKVLLHAHTTGLEALASVGTLRLKALHNESSPFGCTNTSWLLSH